MPRYIALAAIQLTLAAGVRASIEPRSEQHSGLFEYDFGPREESRLLDLGFIRRPEGTEKHEEPTKIDQLFDSRIDDADDDDKDDAASAYSAAAEKAAADKAAAETAAAEEAAADKAAAEKAAAEKAAAEKAAAEKAAAAAAAKVAGKKPGSGDASDDLLNS